MFIPPIVSVIYQEWSDIPGLVGAAVVTAVIGFALWKYFDKPGELSTREGFAAVGMAWIAIALMGSLPYLFTGSITGITDAVFESAAGVTTTGSSVVPDPSLAVLGWR